MVPGAPPSLVQHPLLPKRFLGEDLEARCCSCKAFMSICGNGTSSLALSASPVRMLLPIGGVPDTSSLPPALTESSLLSAADALMISLTSATLAHNALCPSLADPSR